MNKNLRVSVVIPVYNEEEQLAACLQALAVQTVTPYQVIVVDNNSSDNSVAVAHQFPFVKVISEPRQGVVHARKTGFNAAKGDIIGRIDADTLLPTDWVESVQHIFGDETIDAVSGAALYYNVAWASAFNTIDLFFRRRLSWQLRDRVYLYGANMAIRKRAWTGVRERLCNSGGMHEDYDIAIHLQELGGKVRFDECLRARVSSRRIDVNLVDFMRYVLVAPGTYAQHGIRARWHMYPLVAVCAAGYLPARLLHRGYDEQTDSFSFMKIFAPSQLPTRVDPTTHVAN
ncbi:MAG TPA: glycosyltransferase family A protein [Patescibacteria group bacterium]|nr:glycosyltransferase family A protein [Patescibacteria group bacterium]